MPKPPLPANKTVQIKCGKFAEIVLARKVNIIDRFEISKQNFHFIKIAPNTRKLSFSFQNVLWTCFDDRQ